MTTNSSERLFSDDQAQRIATGEDRLPPGQRLTRDWPVLTYGATPEVSTAEWQLTIWGEVEQELTWSWDDFLALGLSTETNDIHCVTHWSRYDNDWEGVLWSAIMRQIKVKPSAQSVMFHSYGGYTTNVPLEDLASDDHAMLATGWNNAPLTANHGGPVRGMIPSLYFWKSAKWVGGIEFLPQDRPGFWEMYGYHIHGDPWTEQRYS
ncbi:MAG TPA: sulfite oxidase-like oxidoreductase [Dehalococcoidia bacterium]|nr:sulfite oxidase-like oxidoreductase [Dehalococcoidia bacterium]